jgi:hypothetical protein
MTDPMTDQIKRPITGGRLIFVYNANAGIVAGLLDSIHKTVSPATYECSLCGITYGKLMMDRRWKAWLKTLPHEPRFYHRPDFRAAYPAITIALPAILIEHGNRIVPLMTADDIATAGSVDALIAALRARLV